MERCVTFSSFLHLSFSLIFSISLFVNVGMDRNSLLSLSLHFIFSTFFVVQENQNAKTQRGSCSSTPSLTTVKTPEFSPAGREVEGEEIASLSLLLGISCSSFSGEDLKSSRRREERRSLALSYVFPTAESLLSFSPSPFPSLLLSLSLCCQRMLRGG